MDLLEASRTGDIDLVRQALQQGINPNLQDEEGHTHLIFAASEGHQEVIKVLLDAKADPNLYNQEGETPLHWAATNGHVESLNALVAAKADLHLSDIYGLTPLHTSAWQGKASCVEALLDAGSDVNRLTFDGETPLHWGAAHESCVKLLIEAGADPLVMDIRSKFPEDRTTNEASLKLIHQALEDSKAITVTAMYQGDSIMTTLKKGEPLTEGLSWEDENGFKVNIMSLGDLTHVERFNPSEVRQMERASTVDLSL